MVDRESREHHESGRHHIGCARVDFTNYSPTVFMTSLCCAALLYPIPYTNVYKMCVVLGHGPWRLCAATRRWPKIPFCQKMCVSVVDWQPKCTISFWHFSSNVHCVCVHCVHAEATETTNSNVLHIFMAIITNRMVLKMASISCVMSTSLLHAMSSVLCADSSECMLWRHGSTHSIACIVYIYLYIIVIY